MKVFNVLSHVFSLLGVLLMIYAFLGRFINEPTVLGDVIPGGISAASAMLGANSFLLLAILANFYKTGNRPVA